MLSPSQVSPLRTRMRRDRSLRLFAALIGTTAVALGLLAWFAATSVAWFAASPTADPSFGRLNRCLVDMLPDARAGIAVSPDGQRAVVFGGNGVALCQMREDAGAPEVEGLWLEVAAVTSVAFDFDGVLWLSSQGAPGEVHHDQPKGLFRKRVDEPLEHVGDAVAVALVGHAEGVVALDAAGRLYSLAADGRTLGFAELDERPPSDVVLAADASGKWVSLVAQGAVTLFDAPTLERLRTSQPCEVDALWWLLEPGQALVACRPRGSLALLVDAQSGVREEAPVKDREPGNLVPGLSVWVKGCDLLPCTARAP